MVMRYLHLAPEHQASAVDALVNFGKPTATSALRAREEVCKSLS